MAKKKSRRNRTPRTNVAPQPQAAQAPAQSEAVAPPAAAVAPPASGVLAPKAQVSRPAAHSSHNLGLELRMIAILGGGAIVLLLAISLIDPTTIVSHLFNL